MGKLSVTYEGDNREAAEAVLNFAVQSGNIVRGMKQQLGIDRMTRAFEGPDGAVVYVLDYEHIRRVHIVPPGLNYGEDAGADELVEGWIDEVGIPAYVSGAVVGRTIKEDAIPMPWDEPDEPAPVRPFIARLDVTEKAASRIPLDMARHKLAVDIDPGFDVTANPGSLRRSQYEGVRPGYYTGAMRPLVQVLLGVGQITPQTYEDRWLAADEQAEALSPDDQTPVAGVALTPPIFSEFGLNGVRTPFTLKVLYDYRFGRTHGISWGTDGRAYLVEIGTRGVLFMPLALDPVSQTEEGRERYKALYPELFDAELCKQYGPGGSFFEVFGGFPTGATIPLVTDTLDAYIRAGEVVRALTPEQLGDFYRGGMYSSACGWAFHPRGGEAHNTCWAFDGDRRKGYHYAVTISIGAYAESELNAENAGYRLTLIDALGLSGVMERKARRMTEDQAKEILEVEGDSERRDAFDAAEVTPSFTADAGLRKQKDGLLYGFGQIKFSEPILDGQLVSFEFRPPPYGPPWPDPLPTCDAPMYVFYRGETLTVINHWAKEEKPSDPVITTTRQPCQYVGAWEDSASMEGGVVRGNFYTTDIDLREETPVGATSRSVTSMALEGSIVVSSIAVPFVCGTVRRSYFASSSTESESIEGQAYESAVVVPAGDRSIYFTAQQWSRIGVERASSAGSGVPVGAIGTGIAFGATYHPSAHYLFFCDHDPGDIGQDGKCQPWRHLASEQVAGCITDSVSAGDVPYNPCTDPWSLGGLSAGSPPTPSGWNARQPRVNEHAYKIKVFGDTAIHGRTVSEQSISEEEAQAWHLGISLMWWSQSPTSGGQYAQMEVNTNRFGSDLVAYDKDMFGPIAFYGGPAEMRLGGRPCYVGWVA